MEESNAIIEELKRDRDNLLCEKASFIDHLNTYLREHYNGVHTPQAGINDNLKSFLDVLVYHARASKR